MGDSIFNHANALASGIMPYITMGIIQTPNSIKEVQETITNSINSAIIKEIKPFYESLKCLCDAIESENTDIDYLKRMAQILIRTHEKETTKPVALHVIEMPNDLLFFFNEQANYRAMASMIEGKRLPGENKRVQAEDNPVPGFCWLSEGKDGKTVIYKHG